MLYEGRRSTVPASKHGVELDLMERYHWTHQECGDAPDELITEALVRMHTEAKVRKAEQRKMEAKAKRGR